MPVSRRCHMLLEAKSKAWPFYVTHFCVYQYAIFSFTVVHRYRYTCSQTVIKSITNDINLRLLPFNERLFSYVTSHDVKRDLWCPGSGVVLDHINAWSLPSLLLYSWCFLACLRDVCFYFNRLSTWCPGSEVYSDVSILDLCLAPYFYFVLNKV